MGGGLDRSLLPENRDGEAWLTVHEDEMLECVRCGKPFASADSASKIEEEVGDLVEGIAPDAEHSVFEYCGDCRSRLLSGEATVPEEPVNEPMDEGFAMLETWLDDNRDRPLVEVRQELNTEYTGLFVGPRPPVLPHESYYREDTDYLGEGLAAVTESYRAAGWSSPDDYEKEDDFIADMREHADPGLFLAAALIVQGLVRFEDEIVAQVA